MQCVFGIELCRLQEDVLLGNRGVEAEVGYVGCAAGQFGCTLAVKLLWHCNEAAVCVFSVAGCGECTNWVKTMCNSCRLLW